MPTRRDILALSESDLAALVADMRLPRFRATQLWEWLWVHRAASFDEMTNLPKSLRANLAAAYRIPRPMIAIGQESADGTRKYLVSLDDAPTAEPPASAAAPDTAGTPAPPAADPEPPEPTHVETVAIPSAGGSRLTVCVSTQAGCQMGCTFCATGRAGFERNLAAHEIYAQVALAAEDFGARVTNIVCMGQGEPFANYNATIAAMRLANDPRLTGIGARHITISTCGITSGIRRLAAEPEQFTLAVSLHSAIQETRDALMPGARSWPLDSLRTALTDYATATRRRPSLEYALIDGRNDDDAHLEALCAWCSGMLCHVNLITLNPLDGDATAGAEPMRPSPHLEKFRRTLESRGIETSVRTSRGSDIAAACGQLRQRVLVL